MNSRGDASNPFWWVVLGFICGAVATLGALILHGSGREAADAASSDADVAVPFEPRPPRAAPSAAQPEAPPPAAPVNPEPAPATEPSPPALDPQIADDAAATGMTARSPRN